MHYFAVFGKAKTEQKLKLISWENLLPVFIHIMLGIAKVQGDRKALPLKPQGKAKHLARCEGSINSFSGY